MEAEVALFIREDVGGFEAQERTIEGGLGNGGSVLEGKGTLVQIKDCPGEGDDGGGGDDYHFLVLVFGFRFLGERLLEACLEVADGLGKAGDDGGAFLAAFFEEEGVLQDLEILGSGDVAHLKDGEAEAGFVWLKDDVLGVAHLGVRKVGGVVVRVGGDHGLGFWWLGFEEVAELGVAVADLEEGDGLELVHAGL